MVQPVAETESVKQALADPVMASEQLWETRTPRFYGFIAGAMITALLGAARLMLSWWPLHPIGFLMVATYPITMIWFSVCLGWMAKAMVMRYGGTGLYTRMKPVAIGMIAGEALAAGLFMVIVILGDTSGHSIEPFKFLPG